MFAILYFIFSTRLGAGIEHYGLYLLLGLIQWNFLNLAAGTAMRNILLNGNLIKSMRFERETLITSSVVMALLSHFFELIVFALFLLFFGVKPVFMLLFPFILALQFFFVLGLCLALGSWIIYFRDLENIWVFASRLWWFLTPIFYMVTKESGLLYTINLFNPMYYLIDISRGLLIYGQLPEMSSLLILSGFSILSVLIGYIMFTKLKRKFAELV